MVIKEKKILLLSCAAAMLMGVCLQVHASSEGMSHSLPSEEASRDSLMLEGPQRDRLLPGGVIDENLGRTRMQEHMDLEDADSDTSGDNKGEIIDQEKDYK